MAASMISIAAAVMGVTAMMAAATKIVPSAQAIGGIRLHNRFSRHTRERLRSACSATMMATHMEATISGLIVPSMAVGPREL